MTHPLLWIHSDSLTRGVLPRGIPAVFVFDDEQIEREAWTLKRIAFLYECLLEIPNLTIHRGSAVQILTRELAARRCSHIVTVDSPDPWIRATTQQLQQTGHVEVLDSPSFVDVPGRPLDLKRFARYWKRVEPHLMTLD
jgi:hypothetical protein